MIVTCEACSARYKLDDSKVSAKGAKITCPRCRQVFVVYPKGAPEPQASEHVVRLAHPAPKRRTADDLDFRTVGIASWKVRVKIGLVYDFSDLKTLRKYIADGRVTPEDAISFDANTWTTIGDIPDLDSYFVDIYEKAEARISGPPSADDGFDDEAPTTISGGGSLANNLARMALAQVENEQVDLPEPRARKAPAPGVQTSSQFVDPFSALKDRQRERIAEKRASTGEAARVRATSDRQGQKNAALLVLLAIALLGGGAFMYTSTKTPPSSAATNVTSVATAVAPAQTQAEIRAELERTMRDELNIELDGEDEEEAFGGDDDIQELRTIVPEEFRNGTPVATPPRPAYAPPTTQRSYSPPSNPDVTISTTTYADHIANGDAMYGSGNFSGAATAYRAAHAMKPSARLQVKQGVALFKAGRHNDAHDVLSGATSQPIALLWLARVAKAQGDLSGANGYYQQYLATDPSDAAQVQDEMKSLM